MKNEQIDIAQISETHLTAWTSLKSSGYQSHIQEKHPSKIAHGEAAVLIKGLMSVNLNILKNITSKKYNAGSSDLNISAISCPPRYKVDDKMFTILFQILDSRYISGGDYNVKHTFLGSRLITTKWRDLFKSANKIKAQIISNRKLIY